MKIVKTKDFIKMPAGTIFACIDKDNFMSPFEIKVDTGNGESFLGAMPINQFEDAAEFFFEGDRYDVEFDIYDTSSADVIQYDLIAILEEKDVRTLISKLEWALNGCKDT